MQIPLRASGSSEIFPGTARRPDQTRSHYWPYGQLGNYWRRRERVQQREKRKKKKEMEAYLQPGHTHLTHRERVNCNLPSKTAVYQAFTWKMSGRERAEQGDIDGNKSVNICLWITVVNCEHCCLSVCLVHCFAAKMAQSSYTVYVAMHMQC